MPRNTPGGRLRRVDTQVRLPRIPNFRYGVTPTASRLYSLVRKGSMSTPADVLNRFWQDLRDRTRVKIDHPDLPDVMKQVAAEAVLTIWRAASERATTELAALRAEARHQTHEAQAIRDQTIVSLEAAQQEVVTAQAQLDAGRAQLAESREALSAERQAHAATDARLQETRRQLDDASHQRAQLKIEFDIELEHARERAEAAETRALAHEKRALREIDQERTARQKSEKHLEELRAQLQQRRTTSRTSPSSTPQHLPHRARNWALQTNRLKPPFTSITPRSTNWRAPDRSCRKHSRAPDALKQKQKSREDSSANSANHPRHEPATEQRRPDCLSVPLIPKGRSVFPRCMRSTQSSLSEEPTGNWSRLPTKWAAGGNTKVRARSSSRRRRRPVAYPAERTLHLSKRQRNRPRPTRGRAETEVTEISGIPRRNLYHQVKLIGMMISARIGERFNSS